MNKKAQEINHSTFEDYIKNRFAQTHGAIEANSYERYALYFELKKHGNIVEQISDGIGIEIGKFHGKSVFVSFLWYKVNGQFVVFYEATSVVVNHDMIKEWFALNMKHIKHFSDAMNSHNVLNSIGANKTKESVLESIKHVKNQHAWEMEQLNKQLEKL